LLFIQVAYFRFFFPATILTAWFWMSIIGLLIVPYYGVYVYASGLRGELDRPGQSAGTPRSMSGMTRLNRTAGWLAAVCFIAIGWLFSNGFSLMTHVEAWPRLFASQEVGGAVLGTASNAADASLWSRWLMMFSLAVLTTATWMRFDAGWFAGRESADYRRWAAGFAPKLATAGLIGFAVMGSWYVFGNWPDPVRQRMFAGALLLLTALTALAPGAPWLVLMLGRKKANGLLVPTLALLAQFGVIAVNAISRQVKQNVSLNQWFDISAQATAVQWGAMALFLITFVVGAVAIVWMLLVTIRAVRA